jgi:hypothetical protein
MSRATPLAPRQLWRGSGRPDQTATCSVADDTAPELRQAERLEQITVEQALAHDPSKSTRSALILRFASPYFRLELCRPFGGTLLHSLHPLPRHDALSQPTPAMQTIVRLLVEFEAILVAKGVLASDFALCVCRKK